MRRFIATAIVGLIGSMMVISARAQDSGLTPYSWDEANLALAYPADWDAPIVDDQDGRLSLQMAQTLADQPDSRPPGIPIIHLTLIPNDVPGIDLTPYIAENFDSIGIAPVGSTAATLLGYDALIAEGKSSDGLLFGVMRAVELPDNRILLVTGRAVEAQHDDFTRLFNEVADSIVLGASSEPATPTYGVLWNTTRTGADGESAFINLTGVAIDGDKVYSVDPTVGVIAFDAKTGAVLGTYPNEAITLPSAIVARDGVVYLGDTTCQCIQVLRAGGQWDEPILGFGEQSPASITVAPDGSLYATDQTDNGIEIQVINGEDKDAIDLGADVNVQPLLTVDQSGQVLALTIDGDALSIKAGAVSPLYHLNLPSPYVTAFAVNANSAFVLATSDRGVLIVDNDGNPMNALGRIVANYPMPGEFVSPRGVAAGSDGTLYISDSDGTFGALTAMNTSVAAGRVGSTVLIPGVTVQGTLNNATPQQDWTFNGAAGQTVTISAVDASETGALDVGLKLIAPGGKEEASNDDQETTDLPTPVDAELSDHVLATSGNYTVRVQLMNGSGTYRLGIVQEQPFTLNPDGATQLQGTLEGALPQQRWIFDGKAGQVFTITMQSQNGTLDPALRLIDARGQVIADNDDAADPALGKDAQLVMVKLPADSTYTIVAARFSGEGVYSLTIVTTS